MDENPFSRSVQGQDLLGHSRIKTTQRYCKVSNLKVQLDYHKAIGEVMRRHGLVKNDLTDLQKRTIY